MAYPNPYDQNKLPGFSGAPPAMPPPPGPLGVNGRALGPKMAGYAAAAPPAAAPRPGGGGKNPGGVRGEKQIENFLSGTLAGTEGAFNPRFMEGQISNALASRSSQAASGQDDVQRQLAQSGLGRSPAGAALLAQNSRGAASDFSSRIGDLYGQKAQGDFAGKMGAIGPYQGLLAQRAAMANAAAGRAESARQFDITQANRNKGGGGGGPSADDQLMAFLMQNEGAF